MSAVVSFFSLIADLEYRRKGFDKRDSNLSKDLESAAEFVACLIIRIFLLSIQVIKLWRESSKGPIYAPRFHLGVQIFWNLKFVAMILVGNLTVDREIYIVMDLADRAIGFFLCAISLSIFTYYTFWVIILPFVDNDHFVHKYFLPQEYAILIPVLAGVALLSFLSIFIGIVMLKSKKKKA